MAFCQQYTLLLINVWPSKVNKQDFLQVFQGSGIEKMEDNSKAYPPSYSTNGSRVDLVSSVSNRSKLPSVCFYVGYSTKIGRSPGIVHIGGYGQ